LGHAKDLTTSARRTKEFFVTQEAERP
jgi:hypothetical protein